MEEKFKNLTIRNVDIEVSNFGRIKKNSELVTPRYNHDGYEVVSANNRSIGVHRLVAMAFVENDNPSVKLEVNHIDFDRTNNKADNLEWLSHTDNIKHSAENGRYKMKDKTGENNSNFGNRKLSQFYKENPHVALEKQSRKGVVNGRATPIDMYINDELIKSFLYIGECCEHIHKNYLSSTKESAIRDGISKSISKNRPYKGFTFVKR